jgi:hypothetical protein
VADAVHELGEKLDRIANPQNDVRDMDRRLHSMEHFTIMAASVAFVLAIAVIVLAVLVAVLWAG